jgi:hypothetical protein
MKLNANTSLIATRMALSGLKILQYSQTRSGTGYSGAFFAQIPSLG